MKVIYLLITLVTVFAWVAFELRKSYPALSQVFAGFALLFLLGILSAMFGLY